MFLRALSTLFGDRGRPTLRHTKAVGADIAVIGAIAIDTLVSAAEELGPVHDWPRAERDRHHLFAQGRSILLRGTDHRDTALRARYRKLEPIISSVLGLGYGVVAGKIVAAGLPPGARIGPHTDSGIYYEYHNRIHVPLATAAGVTMTVGSSTCHLEFGKIYLVQNQSPHAVVNDSSVARVHLIIDLLDSRYSVNVFRHARPLLISNVFGLGRWYQARCFKRVRQPMGWSRV